MTYIPNQLKLLTYRMIFAVGAGCGATVSIIRVSSLFDLQTRALKFIDKIRSVVAATIV